MSDSSESFPKPFQPRPAILLLGDSLTQLCWEGWGAHLANVYQRRADVINRGFSGYNTKFLLQVPKEVLFSGLAVEKDVMSPKCCLTIVWLGANDAGLPGLADHHYVSVEDYRANLHKLIDRVQSNTKCSRVMLMTPPPVHHEQRLIYQKQRYGDKATGVLERTLDNTGKYAAACLQVAKERELPCCDLYHIMQQQSDWASFLHDGLHFSQAGHQWLGPTVVQAIQTNFPELAVTPDPITGQFGNSASLCTLLPGNLEAPFHDEIDHTNVQTAFTMTLTSRSFFGGTIQCQIPHDWRDVSNVRQVPDHQECWQSMGGQVLVMEILSREKNVSNEEAASYFFKDLAEANGITSPEGLEFYSHADMPLIDSDLPPAAIVLGGAGKQLVAQGRDTDRAGNPRNLVAHWTRIDLCVIRLPNVASEVLVTLTSPGDAIGASLSAPNELFGRICHSIRFVDWSLFG